MPWLSPMLIPTASATDQALLETIASNSRSTQLLWRWQNDYHVHLIDAPQSAEKVGNETRPTDADERITEWDHSVRWIPVSLSDHRRSVSSRANDSPAMRAGGRSQSSGAERALGSGRRRGMARSNWCGGRRIPREYERRGGRLARCRSDDARLHHTSRRAIILLVRFMVRGADTVVEVRAPAGFTGHSGDPSHDPG
jgi:hypothetical protein